MENDSTGQPNDENYDDAPLSKRLSGYEKKWHGIYQVIGDPRTRAFERLLMVACVTLALGFAGLSYCNVPWFVYIIFSASILGIGLIAYYGREPPKNQGSP